MIKPYDQLFYWPNLLTLLRILLIPLLVFFYYLPFHITHMISVVIFLFASGTDWLDGYLARYLKQTTKLGAFLDPVADKLMVSVVLVILVSEPTLRQVSYSGFYLLIPTFAFALPAAVIVARELVVSALREWMAELGSRTAVSVSKLGKIKTLIQMVAIALFLFVEPGRPNILLVLAYIFLYSAAILTVWSMLRYLHAAWIELNRISSL